MHTLSHLPKLNNIHIHMISNCIQTPVPHSLLGKINSRPTLTCEQVWGQD